MDILWLEQVRTGDRLRVGGKASVLGELARHGLPVPPGFCLPSDFHPDQLDETWPEIWEAYCQLAGEAGLVAVRSSGVAEDSAGASYAGQYETILNVQGAESLRAALVDCWESQNSPRLAAYRSRTGDRETRLALLVHKQVQARLSGVLFTRHPLTGDTSHMLLEVTEGLGGELVGGKVAPVQVQVDRQGKTTYSPTERSLLSGEEIMQLVRLGESIDTVLGPGQDIEWAIEGNQVFVLQARPVTGAATRLPIDHLWTRANVGEVLPGVTTPLTWSVFQALLSGKWDKWPGDKDPRDKIGQKAVGARWVNGRVYIRLDALLDSFCYLPGTTSDVLGKVLGVILPEQAEPYTPPSGLPVQIAQVLFRLDALGLFPRMRWLLKRLPDIEDLRVRQEEDLLSRVAASFRLHLRASAYAIGCFAWLERWVGLGQGETDHWLALHQPTGRPMQSADQGRILWKLAEKLRDHPQVLRLYDQEQDWESFRRSAINLEGGLDFLNALQAFLKENGARAAGEFELAVARWEENPGFLMGVLRSYLEQPNAQLEHEALSSHQQQADLETALETVVAKMGVVEKRLFHRLMASFARYTAMRENLKYRLMQGFARLRQHFLQTGAQFVIQGSLETVEDIFCLHLDEIRFLRQGSDLQPSAKTLVRERKKQLQEWEETAAPALIHDDLALSRVEAREENTTRLHGIGCSPGEVTGNARVLQDLSEIGNLQSGEILVTPHTDPGWTPLFLSCKAVVTEIGGFLSHGATVAREYAVPFVANVFEATTRIRTGDLIRVNGAQGTVDLLASTPEQVQPRQQFLESEI